MAHLEEKIKSANRKLSIFIYPPLYIQPLPTSWGWWGQCNLKRLSPQGSPSLSLSKQIKSRILLGNLVRALRPQSYKRSTSEVFIWWTKEAQEEGSTKSLMSIAHLAFTTLTRSYRNRIKVIHFVLLYKLKQTIFTSILEDSIILIHLLKKGLYIGKEVKLCLTKP